MPTNDDVTLERSLEEKRVEDVRDRYGKIAGGSGCCCGDGSATVHEDQIAQRLGYSPDDLGSIPEGADLGLGCGAPVAMLDPKAGETVLDLGSGAGVDVFLAARAVGPSGHVIGVDMTPEMLAKARANAEKAGFSHVEFREGRLESLPVADGTVDAVTSNCVINLVPDKQVVFREVARVLKPGGRIVISDVVLKGELPEVIQDSVLAYTGCISGADQWGPYFDKIEDAGLGDVEVLKDRDFIEAIGEVLPPELTEAMKAVGVTLDDVRGKVRSITYRAIKPKKSCC
jgi:SAM-dependent methyltransferase